MPLKYPKQRPTAKQKATADDKVRRVQAESHAAGAGVYSGRKQPKRLSEAAASVGGRTAYESWVREAGFEKDARILEWGSLEPIHRERWSNIARAVYSAVAL
jgi:hypothetical protein